MSDLRRILRVGGWCDKYTVHSSKVLSRKFSRSSMISTTLYNLAIELIISEWKALRSAIACTDYESM